MSVRYFNLAINLKAFMSPYLDEIGNTMKTIEISRMSKVERLQTMEAIWDSLIHENSEIESPEWHRDILAARKKNIEEGKVEFRSIEELRSRRSR
jgi:putative addiction module component (TIGR02574 family)